MVDIRAEPYTMQDRLLLVAAGDALIGWAVDLAGHEADGTRWNRHPNDDPGADRRTARVADLHDHDDVAPFPGLVHHRDACRS
jgi:hypothetical protein